MKLFEAGLIILIVVFLATVIGGQAHKFSKEEHWTGKEEYRGDDNVVEQNAEVVIKLLSGVDEDLTPESPDPDGHGSK